MEQTLSPLAFAVLIASTSSGVGGVLGGPLGFVTTSRSSSRWDAQLSRMPIFAWFHTVSSRSNRCCTFGLSPAGGTVRVSSRAGLRLSGTNPEEFSALLSSRRTVRDFKPDPIPKSVLDAVLEDARECASWSNTRPYAIAMAQGEQLGRISERYLAAYEKALPIVHKNISGTIKCVATGGLPDGDFKTWKKYPPKLLERSRQVGKALYSQMGIPRGDREARDDAQRENFRFFGAPSAMFFFVHKELLPFSAMDAGILLQTIMLSAKAHGISTCPLGVMATWRRPVDSEFAVPKDYKLITGLALGYPTDSKINGFRAVHPPVEVVPARLPRS